MDKTQALNIIRQACGSVQADLATHQQIQTAIQTIEEELKPKTVDVPKEEKSKK